MINEWKLAVARGILEQLGGNRFAAITGARDYRAVDGEHGFGGLSFRLPSRRARQNINAMMISRTADGTYDVQCFASNERTREGIGRVDGVPSDALAECFVRLTGLETIFGGVSRPVEIACAA